MSINISSNNLKKSTLKVFRELRNQLTKHTERAQPYFGKTFFLTTDASNVAIGVILSQEVEIEGKERMVYAFSKTLNTSQKNYSVSGKELLAVVKAVKHFL